MPTLGDHMASTFASCRRSLPDRIGCGGFVFWGPADGPAAILGLEGTCTHCGTIWYTGDVLAGRTDAPFVAPPRGRGRPKTSGSFRDGNSIGKWTRLAQLRKIA